MILQNVRFWLPKSFNSCLLSVTPASKGATFLQSFSPDSASTARSRNKVDALPQPSSENGGENEME